MALTDKSVGHIIAIPKSEDALFFQVHRFVFVYYGDVWFIEKFVQFNFMFFSRAINKPRCCLSAQMKNPLDRKAAAAER
jgi:hypothetical protein